ncbi:hypothetical protein C8R46DRAFT_1223591 [Mycena filopes]|nr:hypothetical protein C8R46DRAFT_1223591 [Mycena filopes]
MPADAAFLVVHQSDQTRSGSLFINCHGDRRPAPLTLDEALYWGNDLAHDEMNVLRHERSPSHRAYQRLLRDAEFHATHLSALPDND